MTNIIGGIKKTIDTRTALHEYDKTDKKTTDSRIDLQRAQLAAQGFDMSEGLSIDILADMAALGELDVFRIEAKGILMQWQNQIPKNQLIVEIENTVRKHFKSTNKTYEEIDCKTDKGKEVYSILVQKNVLDDIAVLHDPVLNEPFFSVPIYESYLLDFRGTIFLNNLECDRHCREDNDHYLEIVKIISQKPGCWLVAYTEDFTKFSDKFLDVFGKISLNEKDVTQASLTGRQPEGGIGQTNAKNNLSKQLEYIRLDEDDNMFYAKVKGKDREEKKPLKLSGQPYDILHCLWYKYDSKTQKASVTIDEVLHKAGIKEHKKGDNISKNKRDHLSIKITPIKEELDIAGFSRDRIKIIGDHCEFDIKCL